MSARTVRNDRAAVAPMRGLLIGVPLGLVAWVALVELALLVASRPDPISWLAAYVVGPAGFLLAVGGVLFVAVLVVRDFRSSFAQPPRAGEGAGSCHGRRGPALPPSTGDRS